MKVINIGSQYQTSRLALELAKENKNMFASVGLHPIHVGGQEYDEDEVREKVEMSNEEQLVKIRGLLESDNNNRIVTIGETGLDYYRIGMGHQSSVIKDAQEKIFIKHIKLAQEFNKPLMLHCRGSKENPVEAYENMLKIINYQLPAHRIRHRSGEGGSIISSRKANGMIHCFSSSVAIAKHFLDMGFYVGFTGIITFPNAGELINVVREVPLNRILTETDSPYLAPQPVRGQRNEPKNVEYIGKRIAEIKNISYDEVQSAVEENANNLFKI